MDKKVEFTPIAIALCGPENGAGEKGGKFWATTLYSYSNDC